MKNLIIGLLLTLSVSFSATASEYCKQLSVFSENALELRNYGYPLFELIEMLEGEPMLIRIATEIYRLPRYSTTGAQQRQINKVRDEVYIACIESENS